MAALESGSHGTPADRRPILTPCTIIARLIALTNYSRTVLERKNFKRSVLPETPALVDAHLNESEQPIH